MMWYKQTDPNYVIDKIFFYITLAVYVTSCDVWIHCEGNVQICSEQGVIFNDDKWFILADIYQIIN